MNDKTLTCFKCNTVLFTHNLELGDELNENKIFPVKKQETPKNGERVKCYNCKEYTWFKEMM